VSAPASADLPQPGPAVRRLIPAFALGTVLLHLTALTRYGWFRDELYYMASTHHLAWGYVDHPPLSIAILTLVRSIFGESLAAARLTAALFAALAVALTGRLAREAGGGRFAQGLACLCALFAPLYVAIGHYYSMNVIETAIWPAAALLLLRALRRGRALDWGVLGVVLGIGLLDKISVSWLGLGIAVGLILTPHRRVLITPGPWLAMLVAGLVFLPHVMWQVRNHFPTLEFMRNATGHKMASVSVVRFLRDQLLVMGPGSAPIWVTGLLFALFARSGRGWRLFAWVWLTVFALLVANGHSRASYLGPAYPMLFAAGAVAWERLLAAPSLHWMRPVLAAVVAAFGFIVLPLALPILPTRLLIKYQTALGLAPRTEERQSLGPLSQQYADMFGWEDLVNMVAAANARLTPEERARARVFGQNYGEAAAVDVLGRKLGLPPAISGHNSYWMWGPEGWDGSVLIIIGGDREDNARFFESIEIIGPADHPYAMPYERHLDVSIGRKLKMPVAEVWPRLKHFI
jgi:hypothetical protein